MTSQHPLTPDGFRRRDFLRRSAAVGAVAVAGSSVLAGCATGGGDDEEQGAQGEKNEQNPLGVDPKAPLDVVIFKGGYGDDYAKEHEKLYQKQYPDAQVKHAGIEKINAELQPRFVGGNPPDVVDNSGDGQMDLGALVNQKQVKDLKDFLEASSIDIEGKTVKETLIPGALESGTFGGKVYALPYVVTAWGFWYDAKTFRDNGWEYPKTWDDLLSLCAEIKRSGEMAPFIYQGKYPAYIRFPLHAMAFRITGQDIWKAVDNLEPNAWKQEPIKQALEAFYELAQQNYILPGTSALTHTDSQARWLQRKAALIPCGSWLENEMKGQIPKDFEMTEAPPPSVTTNDKVPFDALSYFAGEPFIVPTKAKNANGGLEYLRIMCSQEGARKFAELTKSTTAVAGVHDDQDLGPAFKSTNDAINKAQKLPRVPNPRYTEWYKPLVDEAENALGAMMTKKADPDQTMARIQQKADEVAKDDGIKKHER